MIPRRAFVAGIVAVMGAPLAAAGQQVAKVWRIGTLDQAASSNRWTALRDRLRELGYVEGQSVRFESRWGDGQIARLPGLARELVNAPVDIIVTAGSESAAAAKQATNSIPVVITGGDVVGLGVVASLARPGGNVTGVISLTSELGGKRLELLQELIPKASRIGILCDPNNRGTRAFVSDVERAAKALGILVQVVGVRGRADLAGAFMTMKRSRTDAAIFAENRSFLAYRQHVADLAVTHRLPMMAPAKEYALAGVLVSYGTDYLDLFQRAAGYVDKILKGSKPSDMPIEQPTKFELVINLKTAKVLGLSIPPSLHVRADQVIE